MNSLAISLASRGRPEQLVDTIRKSVANWRHKDTVMQVQLDEDDPASYEALIVSRLSDHHNVIANVRPREDTIAEKWNRILDWHKTADVYMSAADDDPYVVEGYDVKILEAAKRFPDGIGTVYGYLANLSFTSISAPTKGLCDRLGYIFPPLFPYWFVDHWIDDVVKMIGRISFADIATDQSKAGKTQEMREPAWWATFYDACYLVRRRQARAIMYSDGFQEEEWSKELKLSFAPVIDQRSRMINSGVRQMTTTPGLSLQDARYLRIKDRAKKMLEGVLADPAMPPQEAEMFRNYLFPQTTVPNLLRKVG
jgi:hypothetical protein